jgi:hypothetical protein
LANPLFHADLWRQRLREFSCDVASEHRRHHKHGDHDDDPYSISKGLFDAHIGWLLFKLDPIPPYDNVADLPKDRLIMWQDKYVHWIAVFIGFILPARVGYLWNSWIGALGAFLIGRVARVVVLQHALSSLTVPVTVSDDSCIPKDAVRGTPFSSRSSPSEKVIITITTTFNMITATA